MNDRRQRLSGKVAVVTGAGSSGPGVGTGKAISILFAREGAAVLLVDRDRGRADETLEWIRREGGRASVHVADVSIADECRSVAAAAVTEYGRLDVLVNNVGIAGFGTVLDINEADWDRVMDVNLKSMMLMSKYTIPLMVAAGGGAIVNISSLSAWRANPADVLPYAVSKAGVVALTINMAVAHGRDNVRVNCVAPGNITTPMAVAGLQLSEDVIAFRRRVVPLGTEGTAWDVAWAVLFLASDEARWITGISLPVDAGLLCTTAFTHLRPWMLEEIS